MVKFGHVNIVAKDWRALSMFYQNVFGCRPMDPPRAYSGEWIESVVGQQGVMIEGEHIEVPGYGEQGPTLEIFGYKPGGTQGPLKVYDYGFAHICFQVDDVPATLNKILENGGSIISAYADPFKERCVYTKDPEGNVVEIHLPLKNKNTYR